MKIAVVLLPTALACLAQDFTHRGFVENRLVLYPQTALNDSGRVVNETLFRYEASRQLLPGLRLYGSFDARTDTHRQVERDWSLNWSDRGLQRPAFSVRRLSALYNRGKLTAEIGKQFIRWGKADILNPTDRFAPRDFIGVVDNEFLGVTAARVIYEGTSNTVDFVWQPRFTPSRTPLLNQRWVVFPGQLANISLRDEGARYPDRSQFGLRVNHLGRGYEASVSYFDGYNHLPLLEGRVIGAPEPGGPVTAGIQRFYPSLRLYGADAAVPLPWFTLKGEAAYFTTRTREADEYMLYVIQLERQTGEWTLVGGYAGEVITNRRSQFDFAPDRGLARAFLGRAGYTIDANRSFAIETAVREDFDGAWLRLEYSHVVGQHWRATAGWTLIRGADNDFLGQYRRNSHAALTLRYSF